MSDLILPIAIAVVGLLGGVFVAFINRNASPYGELAKRVVSLEKSDEEKSERIDTLEQQVGTLKRERDADRTMHAEAVGTWRTRVLRLLEHIDYLTAWITVHGSQDAPRPDDLPDDLRII